MVPEDAPSPSPQPVPPPVRDVDAPGKPEPIPPSPKDPAVFKTAHEIRQLAAIGQSRETLIATLVLIGREKDTLIERLERLEGKLNSESKERESSQKLCAILSERLGSPSILMSGLLTLLSTVLLAVRQPLPTGNGLIIFGGAIVAGFAAVLFAAVSFFNKPKVK